MGKRILSVDPSCDPSGKPDVPKATKIPQHRERKYEVTFQTAKDYITTLNPEDIPKSMQEIPKHAVAMRRFSGFPDPASDKDKAKKPNRPITQMSLNIARALGFLKEGMNLPLRRIWYSFIKEAIEAGSKGYVYSSQSKDKAGEPRELDAASYYQDFGDMIKRDKNLWFSTYGIKNTGKLTFVPDLVENEINPLLGSMFPPILLGIEKTSYFDVVKNMAKMLGISVYSSGGQPSDSASEDLIKRIKEKMDGLDPESKNHLHVYAVTDFDPAGYSVAKSIHDDAAMFLERYGKTVDYERIAPLPRHYGNKELQQGLYTAKGSWYSSKSKNIIKGSSEGKALLAGTSLHALDVLAERDAEKRVVFDKNSEGNYLQGLEVESLPDNPEPDLEAGETRDIIENKPTTMPRSYAGIARMRFIIFDNIIKRHGLDKALKFAISMRKKDGAVYSGDKLSEKFVNLKNTTNISDDLGHIAISFINQENAIKDLANEYVKSDKKKLVKDIDTWVDDVIEKNTNECHVKFNPERKKAMLVDLKDTLYKAIASDKDSFEFDFPEKFTITEVVDEKGKPYPEDFSISIPESVVDKLKDMDVFTKCMKLNADAVENKIAEIKNAAKESRVHPFDVEWNIPQVRGCKIVDGEVVIA